MLFSRLMHTADMPFTPTATPAIPSAFSSLAWHCKGWEFIPMDYKSGVQPRNKALNFSALHKISRSLVPDYLRMISGLLKEIQPVLDFFCRFIFVLARVLRNRNIKNFKEYPHPFGKSLRLSCHMRRCIYHICRPAYICCRALPDMLEFPDQIRKVIYILPHSLE